MNKSPQNQNNSYVLPQRQGISGEWPSFWGFLLLPLMCVRGKISVGCSGKHMQIHTCAVLVGHVAGCPISPAFWAGQLVGEAVPEVLVLTQENLL